MDKGCYEEGGKENDGEGGVTPLVWRWTEFIATFIFFFFFLTPKDWGAELEWSFLSPTPGIWMFNWIEAQSQKQIQSLREPLFQVGKCLCSGFLLFPVSGLVFHTIHSAFSLDCFPTHRWLGFSSFCSTKEPCSLNKSKNKITVTV